MTTSIQFDVVLTPKLWLADERAWRVGLLNLPGSAVEALYVAGQFRRFKVERDRVVWVDAGSDTPASATLQVSLVAQAIPSGAARARVDSQATATSRRHKLHLVVVAVAAMLVGSGVAIAAISWLRPGPTPMIECGQALARLETLSALPGSAEDIKKAIQREIPTCRAIAEASQ